MVLFLMVLFCIVITYAVKIRRKYFDWFKDNYIFKNIFSFEKYFHSIESCKLSDFHVSLISISINVSSK